MSAQAGELAVTRRSLSTWPAVAQWAALLVLSAMISVTWDTAGLPAGLLLGPMIAGTAFGVAGSRLSVTGWPNIGAQAVIAAMARR